MKGDTDDPKALIREAYNLESISPGECRSIFLDWALGVPAEADIQSVIRALLLQYAAGAPNHPMTEILREGLLSARAPKRRGGWRARKRAS